MLMLVLEGEVCARLDREVMPMDILSLFAARSKRCKTIEHEHDLVAATSLCVSAVETAISGRDSPIPAERGWSEKRFEELVNRRLDQASAALVSKRVSERGDNQSRGASFLVVILVVRRTR